MFTEDKYTGGYLIKRILREYVRPYKLHVAIAAFFMVIVALCTALIVKLVGPAIDEIFLTHNKEMLIFVPCMMLGIYCVKGTAEYFQSYLIKYVGQRVLTNLQMQMYKHLLFADLSFIQANSSGKLISRFTNDISMMRGAVSNMLVGCAKHFLSILFLVVIMFKLDVVLAFFVLVVFPIAIYPVQKLGRRMRHVSEQAQEELGNYTARLDETFHSIKVIKSFSAEMIEVERAKKITDNILQFYKRSAKFDALTSPIMEILSGLAVACILWYGGLMVMEGKTTPGALMTFITAFVSAYRPFKSLVSLNVNLQEGLTAANRVFNILDKKPKIVESASAEQIEFSLPTISFHDLSLDFGKKNVLKKVSFTVQGGKTYAIVGRSGSGKTSVLNLLVRFYDPTSGKITIQERDLKDITIESLRKQVAMVTQDTILFDSTIAENISYGCPNVRREQIIEAARMADAHEFISVLPEKYDTMIGIQGLTLSGGQRQRVAIARAFLKDAPILVLDEATSALDSNAEYVVLRALSKLRKGRTTIIVTHRLSSVIDADQIIVMKLGSVAEQGTHQELIEKRGEYYKLYHKELQELEAAI